MTKKSGAKKRVISGHTRAKASFRKPTSKSAAAKGANTPILTFADIKTMVRDAKAKGRTVVTTNGCFDILHIGHARYLEEAKRYGDLLIVGVNSDASVRRNKGKGRPIVAQRERAELIASLKPVDAVFIFDEETPNAWLKELQPNIHVKGSDRELADIVEKDVVEKGGGRIVLAKYIDGHSTTDIVERVLVHRKR